MAIPVTNIPVLTGEVAERFIEQCEYNFSQVPTYNNTSFIYRSCGRVNIQLFLEKSKGGRIVF